MKAGNLDRKVLIQSRTLTQSATGAETESFSTFATVWAERIDLTGREFFSAARENAEITAKFRVRYLAGVKREMQIVDGSEAFDIEHVAELGRKAGLEILAKAAVQ